MLPYPPPTPFSPTQEDLDRLAEALLQSYRETAERERRSAEEKARKDAELRRAKALIDWDESYCFRHRFRQFFSDPRLDVKHVLWGSLIAAVVIPFRLLCLPFQLAALIIRLPMRPARGTPAEGSTPANSGDAQPVVAPPLRLELGKIRSFNELAKYVAAYEKIISGGNELEDDRTPEQKHMAEQYEQEQLLGRCAQISPRLVDAERYAPLKRNASRLAAEGRRRAHFKDRCGATFKHVVVFVSPTKNSRPPDPDQDREAQFDRWVECISSGEPLCPSVFSYEYHAHDGKPHTVRILFDLPRRTLRVTRYECRRLERKEINSVYFRSEAKDYLPDEEIGSFERTPSEKLWREFLDYLINERIDHCPVSLNEQAVRPVSWTLDVEFGDYEVHVGDHQTGPIGDKLSLMVGRLIA